LPKESLNTSHNPQHDVSNLRTAGETEVWSVLSRFLTFEEPDDRFSQLRKSVRKQFDKKAPFDALPLKQQAEFLRKVYNARPQDAAVNFALAFEDLRRFNQLTFASWMKSDWQNPFASDLFDAGQFKLTAPEKLWLNNSIASTPGWWQLLNGGNQWADDPRVKFITSFTSQTASQFQGTQFKVENSNEILDQWRKHLAEKRSELPGSFLPEVIVLVEGQSETLILPAFARLLGTNFNAMAIHIEACHGAKQVVKHYLNLKELTVLPIVCVLDADVSESAEIISDSLRSTDKMITVSQGEIEDSFSNAAFHRLINIYLRESGCLEPIPYAEIMQDNGDRLDTIDRLFRIRGLGNFDKIGFAETVANNLSKSDVPEDGKRIIGAIVEIHNAGSKLRF